MRRVVAVVVAAGLVFAGLVHASPASAAGTCTIWFSSAASSVWENPDNWSLTNGGPSAGRVPVAGDTVCDSWDRDYEVKVAQSTTIGSLMWSSSLIVGSGVSLSVSDSGSSYVSTKLVLGPRSVLASPGTIRVGRMGALDGSRLAVARMSVSNASWGGLRVVSGDVSLGASTSTGDLRVDTGATVSFGTVLYIKGAQDGPETRTFSGGGTVALNCTAWLDFGGDDTWDIRVPIRVAGEINASVGQVVVARPLDLRNGVLTSGDWYALGTGDIELGRPIRTIGAQARVAISPASLSLRDNARTVSRIDGYLGVSGEFVTTGPVRIGAGGEAFLRAGAVIPDLVIDERGAAYGGGLVVTGTIQVNSGGALWVAENPVHADVVNAGIVRRPPYTSDEREPEAIDGDYTGLPGSQVRLRELAVSGTATLAGRFLRLAADGNQITAPGTYPLLTAASVVGRFDVVAVDASGPVTRTYTPTSLQVTVAPRAAAEAPAS